MSVRPLPGAGDPFVRPTRSRARIPDGWEAVPAGRWDGEQAVIVCDPRRHVFALMIDNPGMQRELRADGWRCIAAEGDRRLWAYDRVGAARRALARHDHAVRSGPQPAGRDALGL